MYKLSEAAAGDIDDILIVRILHKRMDANQNLQD